jgi:hypothetical protein
MNWKTDLKLSDLDATTLIEITCKRCRTTHTLTQAQIMEAEPGFKRLYIDEVEYALHCSLRACRGGVRISLVHDDKNEGFVGGLA